MPEASPPVLRFGVFEVDLHTAELRKSGQRVKLQEQPFQILAMLLKHPGELVTREELERKLWRGDTFVDFEHSLATAIKKLREALGDSADNPRFVETLPRRGYRFIAPVDALPPVCAPGAVAAVSDRRTAMRTSPLQKPWAIALVVAAAFVVAAGFWGWQRAARVRVPRIATITQITHDGLLKAEWGRVLTDGTHLYFNWTENDSLAEVSVNGGDPIHLPLGFKGLTSDMAPNGFEMLVGEPAGATSTGELPLWIVRVPDGTRRRVGGIRVRGASWSPDGRRIAYARGHSIEVCREDGTGIRSVIAVPGFPFDPRWSPDGKRMRFLVMEGFSFRGSSFSMWQVDSDGRHLQQLLRDWSVSFGAFIWLADGSFLFGGNRGGVRGIWVLRPGSREPALMTTGPTEWRLGAASPDGTRVYAVGSQQRGEVMRFNAGAGEFTRFGSGLSADGVEFSPDGKWIAYVAYPEGTLWRSRPDGTDKVQLTTSPAICYLPRWSPDGQHIAIMMKAPGAGWKVQIVPAGGGAVEVLLPGPGPEADPNWSPDGSKLLYAPLPFDVPAERRAIFVVDFATRGVTKLPGSEGLFSPRWSPDGRYIVALTAEAQGLKLLDVRTRRWSMLHDRNAGYPNWSRDGRYVYFMTFWGENQQPAVGRIRVPGSSPEVVAVARGIDLTGTQGDPWVGLTPDGAPMILRDLSSGDIYELRLTR